jgi:hypothetical protein
LLLQALHISTSKTTQKSIVSGNDRLDPSNKIAIVIGYVVLFVEVFLHQDAEVSTLQDILGQAPVDKLNKTVRKDLVG